MRHGGRGNRLALGRGLQSKRLRTIPFLSRSLFRVPTLGMTGDVGTPPTHTRFGGGVGVQNNVFEKVFSSVSWGIQPRQGLRRVKNRVGHDI